MRPLRSVSCRSLPRPSCLSAITVLLLAAVCALPSAADWIGSGLPITALPGDQTNPLVAPDGAGGLYVAWQDGRALPDGGLRLLRLTPDGDVAPGWPAAGVQKDASLVYLLPDDAGGVLLVGDVPGGEPCPVKVWHIGPGADSLGCTTLDYAVVTAAATDDRGGALLATVSTDCGVGNPPTSYDIGGFRVDGGDSPVWVNAEQGVPWDQVNSWAAVTSDGAGGAFVMRCDGLIVQRFDSTGAIAAGWPPAGRSIGATVGSDGTTHLLLPNSNNGAILVWRGQGAQPGDLSRLYAARVTAGGTTIVAEQQLTDDPSAQEGALAVPFGGGGAVLAWQNLAGGWAPYQAYAVVLPAYGGLPLTPFPISPSHLDQSPLALAWDGADGAYVAWLERNFLGDTARVFVQRFTSAGLVSPGWPAGGLALCDVSDGFSLAIRARLLVSGGQPYVVWQDKRRTATDPGAGYDVYAAKLTPDGTVPVLASLLDATVTADGVRLRWWAARGPAEARVQRSADGAAWSDIGGAPRDGLGYYAFTDATTAPGDRLAYRLATALGEPLCAAAWVSVPAGPRLALGLVDLAASPPSVHLSLTGEGSARLEVFDVQGRRLESLDLGGRGAGEHVLTLRGGLAPGVFVLRLSQAGMSVTKRAARLR